MTPQKWLDVLCDRIRNRIEASGWTLSGAAKETALLADIDVAASSTVRPSAGALAKRVLVVDPAPFVLLIAFVSADPDDFRSTFESLLWWAGTARQHVESSRRDDLHLIIVTRPTELRRPAWRALAGAVENNQHLCRTFVWVAPEALDQAEGSADLLLDRTFLARPWQVAPHATARALDPLAGILQDKSLKSQVSPEELGGWLALLSSSSHPGQDVAEQMVRTLSAPVGDDT